MELTILATSDMHGYVLPTNFTLRNMNLPLGASKAATIINKERDKSSGPLITIENGDYIQGSPLSYYIARQKQPITPKCLINVLNLIKYDIGVIGNHEFNYGLDYLKKAINEANYPVICANILDENNKPFVGKAYEIIEKKGIKIGVLGLTTKHIPNWELPENIKGLKFKGAVETAKKYIPKLREICDVVIVSYHGGFEKDLETGRETEGLTGENEAYDLLQSVQGIDALITGHQHRCISGKVNSVPVVQPGSRGEYVGKIKLTLSKNSNGKYIVKESESYLIKAGEEKVNEEVLEYIKDLSKEVENWLDKPLGKVIGDMKIYDSFKARITEHPYIEFIQRVQMAATGADISATSLFDNEGKGFGEIITMRDVVTNYIYPNTLAVLKVSGSDLKEALERSASFFSLNNDGSIGVNKRFIDPKPQYYNYDMYEGINYRINVKKPIGSRITHLTYRGEDIKMEDSFEIVLNQYRGVGGGDYSMYSPDKIIREVQIDMTELIARYLKDNPIVEAKVNNNFKVVSED